MRLKRNHRDHVTAGFTFAAVFVAVFAVSVATPAWSQLNEDGTGRSSVAAVDDYQRFEAERLRQERVRLEKERRKQEQLRLEIQQLQRENERHKKDQLRLENERLRLENEQRERELLQLEIETREQKRAQTVAGPAQQGGTGRTGKSDIYEKLRTIGQLRDDGILTEEEFQRLKQDILN